MSRRPRAYILLEVLVATVILGVVFVAVLRGCYVSLNMAKKVRINEQALFLAQSLMADYELAPPVDDFRREGSFGDDPRFGSEYASFFYRVEARTEEIRYRQKPKGKLRQDLEPLVLLSVEILHREDRAREAQRLLAVRTFVLEPTIHTNESLQTNQLF